MRFTWSFFWVFLLVHMATYVVSSMGGAAYDFITATTIAVVATILIYIVAAIIPDEPVEDAHQH